MSAATVVTADTAQCPSFISMTMLENPTKATKEESVP